MGSSHLRLDLALLRQGLAIGVEFGFGSLEGLARTAELLEHSVYEAGSLRRLPDGLGFTLLNPPLRMGAFSEIRVWVNEVPVPADSASVTVEGESGPRRLSGVTALAPVSIPVGRRSRFRLALREVPSGTLTVRMEFDSVAIPPHVWVEFSGVPGAEAV
ncbi:MAG: hypothetical protein L3K09_03640 [Thermoplasmata archaeon]|nr:hypothetical protein [Thermoplasmata archaeon]